MRRLILPCALTVWSLLTASAFGWLWHYESTPGPQRIPPSVTIASGQYSLLLFLHPQCPCSRATLSELARLTASATPNLTTRVLFVTPANTLTTWQPTSLYQSAASIPGITVSTDPGGVLARHYGARTSGQAILYSPSGQLAFTGGITSSRAHEGDNPGETAILKILASRTPSPIARTPVFGCTLFDYDNEDSSLTRKVQD